MHYNAFNFVSVRPSDPWGRALIEFGDKFAPGFFFDYNRFIRLINLIPGGLKWSTAKSY